MRESAESRKVRGERVRGGPMIETFRRTRWLYHPVTIFLSIQVLWILLMALLIRWYMTEHAQVREIAQRFRNQVEVDGLGWLPLLEGGILLTLILAGVTGIFIYWKKQHNLNRIQQAFVSNVTHELKSPVASIQLALETMALRELSPQKRKEFLSMMLDDTERLTTLIDRILGAARIDRRQERFVLEPVSMRRFIDELLQRDRHLFEKDGHNIVFEKGGDAWVAVDRSAMQVVLSNLIENAAAYSPRGTPIRIRLHRDLRSCRVDVIDSGTGIARKDLNNVFKMFWRSEDHRRTGGTGLGLYIVRNVVRAHRGKVWAVSASLSRGSTFCVRLPRLRKYWGLSTRRSLRTQQATRA